jgi:hypothetical protein
MKIKIATLADDMEALERQGRYVPDEVRMHPDAWASLRREAGALAFARFNDSGTRFMGLRVVLDPSVAGAELYREGKRLRIPA